MFGWACCVCGLWLSCVANGAPGGRSVVPHQSKCSDTTDSYRSFPVTRAVASLQWEGLHHSREAAFPPAICAPAFIPVKPVERISLERWGWAVGRLDWGVGVAALALFRCVTRLLRPGQLVCSALLCSALLGFTPAPRPRHNLCGCLSSPQTATWRSLCLNFRLGSRSLLIHNAGGNAMEIKRFIMSRSDRWRWIWEEFSGRARPAKKRILNLLWMYIFFHLKQYGCTG